MTAERRGTTTEDRNRLRFHGARHLEEPAVESRPSTKLAAVELYHARSALVHRPSVLPLSKRRALVKIPKPMGNHVPPKDAVCLFSVGMST